MTFACCRVKKANHCPREGRFIGGTAAIVIAGPCSVESREQVIDDRAFAPFITARVITARRRYKPHLALRFSRSGIEG